MVLMSHFRIDEILFGILDEQTLRQCNLFWYYIFLVSKINRDDIYLKHQTCNVRQQDRRTITLLITCCDFLFVLNQK